jgi:hypothetical protein
MNLKVSTEVGKFIKEKNESSQEQGGSCIAAREVTSLRFLPIFFSRAFFNLDANEVCKKQHFGWLCL